MGGIRVFPDARLVIVPICKFLSCFTIRYIQITNEQENGLFLKKRAVKTGFLRQPQLLNKLDTSKD